MTTPPPDSIFFSGGDHSETSKQLQRLHARIKLVFFLSLPDVHERRNSSSLPHVYPLANNEPPRDQQRLIDSGNPSSRNLTHESDLKHETHFKQASQQRSSLVRRALVLTHTPIGFKLVYT